MRPSADEYFLAMAELVAMRSTCARRSVGCVLVNSRQHVLATGRNGVATGVPHCRDGILCAGATAPSGSSLELCEAIHAEANALLQCRDVWEIDTVYCTASPCIHCVKLLMNTGAMRIVFGQTYPHDRSQDLWIRSREGRSWELKNISK